MRCSACGWENAEGRKSCGGCGAVLPTVCIFCGARSEPGSRFCEACSGVLSASTPAPPAAKPELPKSFIGGRYRVLDLIGEGANKIVYLCHDMRLHRDVALALVKVEGLDEAGQATMQREVRSLARLGDHPNVVTIYDVGRARGVPCIVSQYMAGGSLENRLKKAEGNRIPVVEAVRVAEKVCEGLEHAHSRGVVHRDLKPANILFTQDGEPKLGDLGFGLILATELSSLMGASMSVGTVAYTSPEQALAKPFDARSDLYSLGAVLYEMVTGRPPFLGENLAAVVGQHLSLPPAPPSWRVPEIPAKLEALILRLLAKSPEERPENAAVLRDELHAIGEQIRASIESATPSIAALNARHLTPAATVQSSSEHPAHLTQAEQASPARDTSVIAEHPAHAARARAASAASAASAMAMWLTRPLAAVSRRPALVSASVAILLAIGFGAPRLERAWEDYRAAHIALRGLSTAGASNRAVADSRDRLPKPAREVAPSRALSPAARLLAAAKGGDAHAQARLGDMYLYGRGVSKDFDQALDWLRKAAQQGDTDAKLDLGLMSAKGEGVPQDYSEALQWFYQAASQGNRDAQFNLAELYLLGEGVATDYAVGVEWLRKSAAQNCAEAECELAGLYRDGRGVTQDYTAALDLLHKAAAQGSGQAEYELGKFYLVGGGVPRDYSQAARWFVKAAERGNPQAQNALGYMYGQGQGVAQNYDQALNWYHKAAAAGYAKAQLNLGLMYENGEGVAQDFGQAMRWYRVAAAQDDAVAQANLGFMYWKGRGASKDYVQAFQWFFKAADQGNAEAQYALGAMYDDGRGVRKDYRQAAEWYERAATQGNRDAQYNLGYMYEYGQGVSQDPGKALQWYRKAADQGDADAEQKLKDFVIGTTTAASSGD